MATTMTYVLEYITAVHLMMSTVAFLYARHKIAYLPLAWIMLIYTVAFGVAMGLCFFYDLPDLGILHPAPLLWLMVCSFLQMVIPLGITMPGYLEAGRMLRYAAPALIIIAIYVVARLFGQEPMRVFSWHDVMENPQGFLLLLRLATLALATYYTHNVFRLPQTLKSEDNMPLYVKGYTTVTGLVGLFLIVCSIKLTPVLLILYLSFFTLTNSYLFYRMLEEMALHLPQPEMEVMVTEPMRQDEDLRDDENDFNAANHRRFERMEFLMQHEKPWKDYTFSRDRLCEAIGINRHLVLQSVRSQGYYNVHEYINRYRAEGLHRAILAGEVRSVEQCSDYGFATYRTAREWYEKIIGKQLDKELKK